MTAKQNDWRSTTRPLNKTIKIFLMSCARILWQEQILAVALGKSEWLLHQKEKYVNIIHYREIIWRGNFMLTEKTQNFSSISNFFIQI